MPITKISGELYLEGDVGNCGFPDFFTAGEVAEALGSINRGQRAKVRLNSGGGIATEGSAVAAAFRAHPGGVEVNIEGIAASAASVIACSAARSSIAFGSLFMIHEATGFTIGSGDDHRSTGASLDVMNKSMAAVYAAKTGKPVSAMLELMRVETWFSAEDAVAQGFVDTVIGLPNDHPAYACFDYRQYRRPPAALLRQAQAQRSNNRALANHEAERGAEIVEACCAAGVPAMASDLIMAPISVHEAVRRIDAAKARTRGKANMLKTLARQGGPEAAQAKRRLADAEFDGFR